MRVVGSPEALAEISGQGGRLYVWVQRAGCCGRGTKRLATSFQRPDDRDFRLYETESGVDVLMPAGLPRLPDELHLELHRFPTRRIDAYWDGLAWVV